MSLPLVLFFAQTALAQTGPAAPADPYTPVHSGELFDTAHVLPEGRRQFRLSTLSHWGLSDRVQLDVNAAGSLFRGPNAGVEVSVWSEGNSAASVTVSTDTRWNFKEYTGTVLGQYTLGVGEHDRLNLGLGFGLGTLATPTEDNSTTELAAWRTVPARVSFDKVVSDRRVRRFSFALDAGPALQGGPPEAEGGYLWTYGFNKFRISAGGGMRYAPTFGDQINAAIIQAKGEPIDFPNVLPKLDLNLWWAW